MHPSRWLKIACLGFLVGVGLGSWELDLHPWLEVCTLVVLVVEFCFYERGVSFKKGIPFFVGFVALFSICLGVWRVEKVLNTPNTYTEWVGKNLDFEGVVVVADKRSDVLLVNVRPDQMTQQVQFRMSPTVNIEYGDKVWVRGKLQLPKSSPDFDYERFLQARGVYAIGYYPKIVVLEKNVLSNGLYQLLRFKSHLTRSAIKKWQTEETAMITGVLLGSKEFLSKNVQDEFSTAGISHILVASGYNLTVLAVFAGYFVWWLGRKRTQILSALLVLIFVGLAGASASVVRAGVMAGLLLISKLVGRQYTASNALLLAGSLMVLFNPLLLMFDVGFQLSFSATAGILLWSSGVAILLLKFCPSGRSVLLTLSTSLSAIVATLPIISFHFGRISLVSLLANLLVVPFVPVLMLLGALSFLPLFSTLFAPLAGWMAEYILSIGKFSGNLPFASLNLKLPACGVGIYYLVVFGIYMKWLKNIVATDGELQENRLF